VATQIDIVNQALSHLGAKANVSSIAPPDGSVEAGLAARFYLRAQNLALSRHDWGFARKRRALTEVVNVSDVWTYAYARPSDCIMPRRILTGDSTMLEDDSAPFSVERDTIFSNEPEALLVYTSAQDVADASRFTEMFVEVVALDLASFMAGPILRGNEGINAMTKLRQAAADAAAAAAAQDASNDRRPEVADQYTPASIRARG
jgi:hypothetical protein